MAVITESRIRSLMRKGIKSPFFINDQDTLTPAASDYLKEKGIKVERSHSSTLLESSDSTKYVVPVGVSNRHIHLSKIDLDILFGKDYSLTPLRELSQKGQFAAKETVSLFGNKGFVKDVRILGPLREETQIEISTTDSYLLGVHPPIKMSGDLEGTPGITVVGPEGVVLLKKGVIIAKRHIHMSPEEARVIGIQEGDKLIVETQGERSLILSNIDVRISSKYTLDFHIDLDEGNAAHLKTGDMVKIIGKNNQFFSWYGR